MAAAASTGGGHLDVVLLGVLVAVAGFLVLAYRVALPYPIPLVVGGLLLGFAPGVPELRLDPDLVLVIFLPPLLYGAAFFSNLRELRDNARPIALLSIGLVVLSTLGLGVVAHAAIDDLPWAAAFTLGAVLSPTDPVAATAIAGRVGAPRRFVTIVEGESLVNDATALIAWRFAVAAAVTGSFSLAEAAGTFVLSAAGGVAVGIGVGWIVVRLRRPIDDAPTEITMSLLTPYFAYLPAEALGASAVLAAVTAGIWLGWRAPQLVTPTTRMQSTAVWEVLIFLLNATLFILLGIQLPAIVDAIRDDYAAGTLVAWSALVTATLVALRFLWVFPATYLPRRWSARIRERDPAPPWRSVVPIAFTGMRGAVSLAAALAIPATTDAGEPFPGRDLIVFLAYVTILVSILGQGLALGPLIRRLGLAGDDATLERRENKARILAARAGLERIADLRDEPWVPEQTAERMRRLYDFRVRRFRARFDDADDGALEQGSQAYQRLRREVLEAERAEIIRLRDEGFIPDEVMRRIERDLDLEDARLDI